MFPRHRSTNGLITVPYNCNFEHLVTNLLLKNFWFAWYALVPRAILSLISPSIELVSFKMDPKYLHCRTFSICKLLIFKFFVLISFFVHCRYLVFFSFVVNPTSIQLFFNCLNVSIRDCLVLAVIKMLSA